LSFFFFPFFTGGGKEEVFFYFKKKKKKKKHKNDVFCYLLNSFFVLLKGQIKRDIFSLSFILGFCAIWIEEITTLM